MTSFISFPPSPFTGDPPTPVSTTASKRASTLTALDHWRQTLGEDKVRVEPTVTARYAQSTSGCSRKITAVLTPSSAEQVAQIVRIANRFSAPIYPISTGRNWGYGSANPVVDDCTIVDLSPLNRILAVDEELGLATIEPGVTQQQLWDYLKERELPFCVPVHGGGPDCSLIGNALERGYGITPYTDHFGGLTSLEAILPNGERYRSALAELGGVDVDRAYKWGLGPYVDGMFSQGAFGVVIQATLALAPRPDNVEGFFFSVERPSDLPRIVAPIRSVLRELRGVCGSINLMNAVRVLSMATSYPSDRVKPGDAVPPEVVSELAADHGIAAWTGAGALYGDRRMRSAARAILRKHLNPVANRLTFLTEPKVRRLQQVASCVPFPAIQRLKRRLEAIGGFLKIAKGQPQRTALKLAYWKSGTEPDNEKKTNPAANGCGLIWYSPLVPMKAEAVGRYVEIVETICPRYGVDPLITLTALSDRVFDSTVPLLFRPDRNYESQNARACYEELFDRGVEHGYLPYRIGASDMERAGSPAAAYWKCVRTIKEALDPASVIAPGRYCL